ncbi:hypothetical protein Tco_1264733 [Tanacetum coccineum]
MRIKPIKTPKEPTYQVVLDSLALSPLYPAFLITAEVPEIYMHQLWHTITKIKNSSSYKFKADKKKCTIDVEVFHDILQICPKLLNQEFDAPPSDEEIVTFIKELRHKALLPEGMTNQQMQDSPAYKSYLAFATGAETPKKARKFKKPASPSKKKTLVAIKEPVEKPAKKHATRRQSAGVQIRDTLGVSVSKKKAPAKTKRSKGIELLSDAALLEEAQLKKAIKRSKQEIHIHQAGGTRVPDVSKADYFESEYESWGDSDDDNDDDD